jgi:hypothetical protein
MHDDHMVTWCMTVMPHAWGHDISHHGGLTFSLTCLSVDQARHQPIVNLCLVVFGLLLNVPACTQGRHNARSLFADWALQGTASSPHSSLQLTAWHAKQSRSARISKQTQPFMFKICSCAEAGRLTMIGPNRLPQITSHPHNDKLRREASLLACAAQR